MGIERLAHGLLGTFRGAVHARCLHRGLDWPEQPGLGLPSKQGRKKLGICLVVPCPQRVGLKPRGGVPHFRREWGRRRKGSSTGGSRRRSLRGNGQQGGRKASCPRGPKEQEAQERGVAEQDAAEGTPRTSVPGRRPRQGRFLGDECPEPDSVA